MDITRIPTDHGKSWNLRKEFSRPRKSWKMTVVMESQGIPPIGLNFFNTRIILLLAYAIKTHSWSARQ